MDISVKKYKRDLDYKLIKHIECHFAELFSLLKDYKYILFGPSILAYSIKDPGIIRLHVNNAVDNLLLRLQKIANLVGTLEPDVRSNVVPEHLDFFISAISKLTQAINDKV